MPAPCKITAVMSTSVSANSSCSRASALLQSFSKETPFGHPHKEGSATEAGSGGLTEEVMKPNECAVATRSRGAKTRGTVTNCLDSGDHIVNSTSLTMAANKPVSEEAANKQVSEEESDMSLLSTRCHGIQQWYRWSRAVKDLFSIAFS